MLSLNDMVDVIPSSNDLGTGLGPGLDGTVRFDSLRAALVGRLRYQ